MSERAMSEGRRAPLGGGDGIRLGRARGPVEGDDLQAALYRRLDYYPTPLWAARAGAELIQRLDPGPWWAWEPACGQGHMAHGLADHFPRVFATDIHDHGSDLQHGPPLDFTSRAADGFEADWIVTNPPNSRAQEFVELGLKRARRGVAILIRTTFLDTQGRFRLFFDDRQPLSVWAVFAERVEIELGGWDPAGSGATPFAWFIWLKPEAAATSPVPRLAMGAHGAFVGLGIPPGTKTRLTKPDDARLFGRSTLKP